MENSKFTFSFFLHSGYHHHHHHLLIFLLLSMDIEITYCLGVDIGGHMDCWCLLYMIFFSVVHFWILREFLQISLTHYFAIVYVKLYFRSILKSLCFFFQIPSSLIIHHIWLFLFISLLFLFSMFFLNVFCFVFSSQTGFAQLQNALAPFLF